MDVELHSTKSYILLEDLEKVSDDDHAEPTLRGLKRKH